MTADATPTPDDHELVGEAFPHLAALARTLNALDGAVIRVTLAPDQLAALTNPNQVAEAMQRWERHNTPQRRT